MLGNGTHWWFFFKRVNPSFNKLHYEKVSLEKDLEKKASSQKSSWSRVLRGEKYFTGKVREKTCSGREEYIQTPWSRRKKERPSIFTVGMWTAKHGIAHEEGQQRVDHQGPRRPSTVCGFILREVGDAWKFWAPGCMTGSAFGNRSLCLKFRDYFSRDKREHPSLSHNNCSYGGWWKWC